MPVLRSFIGSERHRVHRGRGVDLGWQKTLQPRMKMASQWPTICTSKSIWRLRPHAPFLANSPAALGPTHVFEDLILTQPANQKLYTCTTCYPSDETHAPVVFCEACAVKCHPPHHELVDLYSKRNYKCDCGTSACALLSPCSFLKSKQDITNDNVYSANLLNRYCFCEKPYLADKV